MSLEHTAAVVTGAASGIGFATVETLARAGAHVTAVDIADGALAAALEQFRAAGDRVAARVGDVRSLEDMSTIVRDVVRREGRIDALIACAGLADQSSIDDGDPERWQDVLTVNALGPMVTARAAVPHMLQQGHGDIVVVASASGRVTYVGEPAYVASKHAAVAFLDCLRKELADTDIRVIAVEPGLVDTPMIHAHPFLDTILKSVEPLQPTDVAELIKYSIALPRRISMNEVVLRPTRQML